MNKLNYDEIEKNITAPLESSNAPREVRVELEDLAVVLLYIRQDELRGSHKAHGRKIVFKDDVLAFLKWHLQGVTDESLEKSFLRCFIEKGYTIIGDKGQPDRKSMMKVVDIKSKGKVK